jgi:hypothetical protein
MVTQTINFFNKNQQESLQDLENQKFTAFLSRPSTKKYASTEQA